MEEAEEKYFTEEESVTAAEISIDIKTARATEAAALDAGEEVQSAAAKVAAFVAPEETNIRQLKFSFNKPSMTNTTEKVNERELHPSVAISQLAQEASARNIPDTTLDAVDPGQKSVNVTRSPLNPPEMPGAANLFVSAFLSAGYPVNTMEEEQEAERVDGENTTEAAVAAKNKLADKAVEASRETCPVNAVEEKQLVTGKGDSIALNAARAKAVEDTETQRTAIIFEGNSLAVEAEEEQLAEEDTFTDAAMAIASKAVNVANPAAAPEEVETAAAAINAAVFQKRAVEEEVVVFATVEEDATTHEFFHCWSLCGGLTREKKRPAEENTVTEKTPEATPVRVKVAEYAKAVKTVRDAKEVEETQYAVDKVAAATEVAAKIEIAAEAAATAMRLMQEKQQLEEGKDVTKKNAEVIARRAEAAAACDIDTTEQGQCTQIGATIPKKTISDDAANTINVLKQEKQLLQFEDTPETEDTSSQQISSTEKSLNQGNKDVLAIVGSIFHNSTDMVLSIIEETSAVVSKTFDRSSETLGSVVDTSLEMKNVTDIVETRILHKTISIIDNLLGLDATDKGEDNISENVSLSDKSKDVLVRKQETSASKVDTPQQKEILHLNSISSEGLQEENPKNDAQGLEATKVEEGTVSELCFGNTSEQCLLPEQKNQTTKWEADNTSKLYSLPNKNKNQVHPMPDASSALPKSISSLKETAESVHKANAAQKIALASLLEEMCTFEQTQKQNKRGYAIGIVAFSLLLLYSYPSHQEKRVYSPQK